jgi:hypothetical protein
MYTGGMFLFLQRALAAAFLISLAGLWLHGNPPYGVIWRTAIVACGILGLVISAVGYLKGKPVTRLRR